MRFVEKLGAAAERNSSRVCVGLDPDPEKLPSPFSGAADVAPFLKEIVSATRDLACCYKPNYAFFAALGVNGASVLKGVIDAVGNDIPVLLDFKAGDIGNTAERYASFAYDVLGVDGVTVNPLMGADAVDPFLDHDDGCAFLLALTSNPGSADFQRRTTEEGLLYEVIVRSAARWSRVDGDTGLVVGATHPEELRAVRELAPAVPILVPGVGAQGGDPQAVVRAAQDASGGGFLVNASRSILYASSGADFAEAARAAAEDLRRSLRPV